MLYYLYKSVHKHVLSFIIGAEVKFCVKKGREWRQTFTQDN